MTDISNEIIVEKIKNGTDRKDNLFTLWINNKGIIHMIISKYSKSTVSYDDLAQVSFLALCDAVENYDSEKGRFTTYLGFWIKRYCIEELAKTYPLSADRNTLTMISKYKRMRSEYESRFGCYPSDQELQSLLKVDKATYTRIKEAAEKSNTISIDIKDIRIDDDYTTIADSIPDTSVDVESQILDKVEKEQLHAELEEALSELPEEQSQVLRKKYYEERSIKSIALDMGITESEVDKHKDKALSQIRRDRKRYNRLYKYFEEKLPLAYRGGIRGFLRGGSVTERVAIDVLTKEIQVLRIETR